MSETNDVPAYVTPKKLTCRLNIAGRVQTFEADKWSLEIDGNEASKGQLGVRLSVPEPMKFESDDALSTASLRKLNVKAGDTLLLELGENDPPIDGKECDRIQGALRRTLGIADLKLIVTPPGCKLTAQLTSRERDRMGDILCREGISIAPPLL